MFFLMTFHHIGNFIIPTDELNFFRGVAQPPTSLLFHRSETLARTFSVEVYEFEVFAL